MENDEARWRMADGGQWSLGTNSEASEELVRQPSQWSQHPSCCSGIMPPVGAGGQIC